MSKNDILKKYITDKYGSIVKFLKKEKFSPQDLETVLQKKDIFHEIGIGIKLCRFLNIGAVKLFCQKELLIRENAGDENTNKNLSLDDVIKEKYANLNTDERQKLLAYVDHMIQYETPQNCELCNIQSHSRKRL